MGPSTGDQIIANCRQSSSSTSTSPCSSPPSPPQATVVLPSNNRNKCHQNSSPDLIVTVSTSTSSSSAASKSGKSATNSSSSSSSNSIVSGCYKSQSQKKKEQEQEEKVARKKSAKKKTASYSAATSASSSFLAASVAATDQVLLKLVQRLASLRSKTSSSNNNKKNNPKKSKKKKHSTDSAGSGSGGSGPLSPAKCKKPRCDQGGQSGNYHVAEAYAEEEEEAPSAAAKSCFHPGSGHSGAKVISGSVGGKIDCISSGVVILDQQRYRPTFGGKEEEVEEEAVDCDLVFCEVEETPASGEIQASGGDDEIFPEECVADGYCDEDECDELRLIEIAGEEGKRRRRQEQGVRVVDVGFSMGANVSRHHEKGLTGRRAQSTDNLKSDQSSPYHQYHYGGKNNNSNNIVNNNNNNNHHQTQLKSVPPDLTPGEEFLGSGSGGSGNDPDDEQQQQFLTSNGINPHDRNKFCGSLPNHLDADDACEAIFKQNEFLQTHLKNVLASHQQQQPEYVTVASSGAGVAAGTGTTSGHQAASSSSGSSQPPPPYHQQSSPFYSSSSGKGSTISSTALGSSTFRSGSSSGGERPDIQLKLPLHRICPSMDTGYDQGYGSERSPEDELPPPLLLMHEAQYNEILATSQLTQQPPTSVIEPDDLQRFWNYEKAAASLIASGEYSFITKDSVFLVQVPKGTRGLGLSVSGGSDSSAPFPGLIRIKRLFPHQAAWATGMLQPGDILLEANGIPLTGLTNYEALEVLRTAPNYVTLTVCRPQDEQYRKLSPPSEPPKPPLRNPLSSEPASQLQSPQLSSCSSSSSNIAATTNNNVQQQQQQQLLHFQQMQQQLSQYNNNSQQQMMPYYYPQQQQQQQQQYMFPPQTLAFAPATVADPSQSGFSGEFEIILTKQQGSLGFTLRKEDESVLGHYVRALVRDPALNDGRIRPGDKIVAVNDIPISQMTHEEAVIFLRQSAEVVKLRLYRDQAQTPLSAQSPSFGRRATLTTDGGEESTPGHGTTKSKPNLRPEALNLLTDIAHRKQSATTTSNSGGGSTSSSVKSSNASPRRLRRGLQGQQNSKRSYDNHGFQETCSNYSDSETSTIVSHQQQQLGSVPGSGVYHSASCRSCRGMAMNQQQQQQVQLSLDDQYYCDEEIESLYDEEEDGDGTQKRRPNFLDLAGEGGSTPMSSRKPRFQFSVANTNAYELNNLDNEALDAPTVYALKGTTDVAAGSGSSERDQFMSLPCETFLVACKTEHDLNADSTDAIYVKHFAHKSPLYSSVNVPLKENVSEVVDAVEKGGKKSLMKWKGATLTSDEDEESSVSPAQHQSLDGSSPSLTGSSFPTSSTPDAESSLAATLGTTTGSTTTPTTERELLHELATAAAAANGGDGGVDGDGNKIFTVELNKGWNSRLGFSLKQDPDSKRPAISAIYSESVAAKDGRLRVGDQLLTVNDESVETMATGQVIDLLRIIRGSICLRLVRITAQPIDADIIVEEQQQPNHSEQQQEQMEEKSAENADQIQGEAVEE